MSNKKIFTFLMAVSLSTSSLTWAMELSEEERTPSPRPISSNQESLTDSTESSTNPNLPQYHSWIQEILDSTESYVRFEIDLDDELRNSPTETSFISDLSKKLLSSRQSDRENEKEILKKLKEIRCAELFDQIKYSEVFFSFLKDYAKALSSVGKIMADRAGFVAFYGGEQVFQRYLSFSISRLSYLHHITSKMWAKLPEGMQRSFKNILTREFGTLNLEGNIEFTLLKTINGKKHFSFSNTDKLNISQKEIREAAALAASFTINHIIPFDLAHPPTAEEKFQKEQAFLKKKKEEEKQFGVPDKIKYGPFVSFIRHLQNKKSIRNEKTKIKVKNTLLTPEISSSAPKNQQEQSSLAQEGKKKKKQKQGSQRVQASFVPLDTVSPSDETPNPLKGILKKQEREEKKEAERLEAEKGKSASHNGSPSGSVLPLEQAQSPSFPLHYLGSKKFNSFMDFWQGSAGSTYKSFKCWFGKLKGKLDEANAPHVKATYVNPLTKKEVIGGVWKYHNVDAFGKTVTSYLKEFLKECGLTPEFVKNKRDVSEEDSEDENNLRDSK